MAVPRSPGVPRGSRVLGEPGRAPRETARDEPVADPLAPREVLDYALQRRGVLAAIHGGRVFDGHDICDADYYLLRAARFHGEPAGQACPICRDPGMVTVTYVYGDQIAQVSGSAVASSRLADLAVSAGEFRVHVVEVCAACRWNHLRRSFTLGDGVVRRPEGRMTRSAR